MFILERTGGIQRKLLTLPRAAEAMRRTNEHRSRLLLQSAIAWGSQDRARRIERRFAVDYHLTDRDLKNGLDEYVAAKPNAVYRRPAMEYSSTATMVSVCSPKPELVGR
jgi:hypothetical protein